jgi:AmiR/NasT family two-component response regulator
MSAPNHLLSRAERPRTTGSALIQILTADAPATSRHAHPTRVWCNERPTSPSKLCRQSRAYHYRRHPRDRGSGKHAIEAGSFAQARSVGRRKAGDRLRQPDRDILFTDSDLHQPLNAWEVGSLLSVPVIGIVGIESPSRLKFLIQVGATALLRKPIHAAAIYSALFMGINGFWRQRYLECRLEDQERRQRSRRTIVKAIISLMKTAGIDDDQAYAILRRESMRKQLRIEDYCATVIGADFDNEHENTMVKSARKTASLK